MGVLGRSTSARERVASRPQRQAVQTCARSVTELAVATVAGLRHREHMLEAEEIFDNTSASVSVLRVVLAPSSRTARHGLPSHARSRCSLPIGLSVRTRFMPSTPVRTSMWKRQSASELEMPCLDCAASCSAVLAMGSTGMRYPVAIVP